MSQRILISIPDEKLVDNLENFLNDLNLDQKELRRLGVYDILIRPHSNEVVLPSIMSSLQYEAWKNISPPKKNTKRNRRFKDS